jgi:putative YhdH/YhfP family quinone oxidoreductase
MTTESFRALLATQTDGPTERRVAELGISDLPADGVLIEVAHSSVNYKDGLATSASGKVARISPLIPGVDLAGRVIDDGTDDFPVGSEVIAHGYELGVSRHGGFAQRARVPAEWLVSLPGSLSSHDAMVIGTAGFTAALSVIALEDHGVRPGDGPVLVTGATGGVGSTAVDILSSLGFEVIASSGKPDAADYLRSLGASEVIDRSELSAEGGKPLQPMDFAAAVDCVGGTTLANVLARTRYGGAVAASGLTGGAGLPTTVLPFILRGISLLGIDSVETPIERRRATWERLGGDLRPSSLSVIGSDLGLDELPEALDAILRGEARGRSVVDLWR